MRVRLLQLRKVLSVWDGRKHSVILGDLNSMPDSAEQALLREAGLLDAFMLASDGLGKGYTSPADKPVQRIDYIWLSPDLSAREFQIPQSTASDHLGIAVAIDR
jgi:endonuclease/exonuclease/phosphatase family metal-dependent hydrolase